VVYERSASGEPTKITREDGTYTKVEYDSALRVKKEQQFDANNVLLSETSYGYDLDGNRTSKTTLTGSETYSYAAGFKLTSVSHSGGGADDAIGYDNGGRVTSITRNGTTKTLEYDSLNHITKVSEGGIERVRYTFDGAGNRVAADDGTGSRHFLTAPNLGDGYQSPQAVTDASGNLVATFVYAGVDAPFMKITTSGVEYFLADSMGSIVGKTDAVGASIASIRYDAFGGITSATGPSAQVDAELVAEPRYHGMAFDAATGIYYVRARSYDAETGRFLSRDPFTGVRTTPESMHPYAFAYSCPVHFADPSGEFSYVETMVAVTIVGILASTAAPAYQGYLNRSRAYRDGNQAAIDQAATNITAGIGDTVSFGIGKALRELGQNAGWWSDGADESSASYNVGVAAGLVVSFFQGAAVGAANGVRESVTVGQAGITVLGKNPQYVQLGEELGANYFNIPTPVWNALSEAEKWMANRAFLDQAIARGDEIILASAPAMAKAGSWFRLELEYLMYRGYRIAQDGTRLIVP
jgi:RHS repeat-associated protein